VSYAHASLVQFLKMSALSRRKWREWYKLWNKRKKRLNFYNALYAFQERNHLLSVLKVTKRKQNLYKQRMNYMYRKKLHSLFKKVAFLKKKIIKFQLKYGVYDE
jgi:hypothetical protein